MNILSWITNSLNRRNNFPYQQWELRTSRYHFIIIACIVYTSRTNIHSLQVCQWSNNWVAFRRLTGRLSLAFADSLWRRTVIDGFRCNFMWLTECERLHVTWLNVCVELVHLNCMGHFWLIHLITDAIKEVKFKLWNWPLWIMFHNGLCQMGSYTKLIQLMHR